MGSETQAWEEKLLQMATEALDVVSSFTGFKLTPERLEDAYAGASRIIREHSRTFHMASALLPLEKRRGIQALYAFCRISDDIVDGSGADDRLERLEAWRERSTTDNPRPDDSIAVAWAGARAQFGIPKGLANQLVDGVAMDITQSRYATFDDLAIYCYGVASTVGLMSMHITGFAGRCAVPYAVKLGVALQLTNILRDVAEDWRAGRLYLPQDELAAFDLADVDIAQGSVSSRWRAFMKFQIERTRALYEESIPGIALLDKDGRFAVAAAAELYESILDDIVEHDYDVFSRRAHATQWEKLRMLPGIWRKSRRMSVANLVMTE